MKSQEEILARYKERAQEDFLGFEVHEYVRALHFEHAKPYLKEGTTPEEWPVDFKTTEDVLERMRTYVDFAYEKIDNERGISANRTIMHYIAWLWLAGNHELGERVEKEFDTNYHDYGKDIMDMICAQYGWKPSWETTDA
jgi:hypothetical protein